MGKEEKISQRSISEDFLERFKSDKERLAYIHGAMYILACFQPVTNAIEFQASYNAVRTVISKLTQAARDDLDKEEEDARE